ncbi:unnamed protein product [Somion occarium]|uniref:Uncharacterized protein n=1 Tax=Somion occarium TaxID=3059160 RepID=A0ABP1CQ89_9APHY
MTSSPLAMSDSAFSDLPLAVRFDNECVLIPDPPPQSRLPRMVKRSYSLPLWKRRSSSKGPIEVDVEKPPADGAEDNHLHFTVSVPSFLNKARSPTRGEHPHQPLVPCIINHDHPPTPRRCRRPSLSLPPRTDVLTIPLRACCQDCYPITEESLKEGSEWQEKFTHGARRRRNSSGDAYNHTHVRAHRKVSDDTPGFDSVLQVDEVEKLRKSKASRTAEPSTSPTHDDDGSLLPSLTRRVVVRATDITPPAKAVACSPPIEEEDEDQLFPLPNGPRRTPIPSPNPSTIDLIQDANEMSNLLDKLDVRGRDETDVTSDSSPILDLSSSSSSSYFSNFPETTLHTPSTSHNLTSSSFKENIPLSASPPSTPDLHRVTSSERSPNQSWRRPTIHLPGASSIFRASADALRGVSFTPVRSCTT